MTATGASSDAASVHRGRRTAGVLALLAPALMTTGEVLAFADGSGQEFERLFIWAIGLVFAAVGWLVAARHSGNPIGWLFLAAGVAAGLGHVAHPFADRLLDGDGHSLPGGLAALFASISWIPFILVPATFLLLLFPDGHLMSPRWRPIAWASGVGLAGTYLAEALNPGAIQDYPNVMNPIGVDHPMFDVFHGLALLAVLVGIAGSALSLIVRFRRSRGVRRQQLKWLALAGGVTAVVVPLTIGLYDVIGENAANGIIMASVLGLPVAAGIAIRRYRLYQIDLVVNRTIVYSVLTGLLAGAYLGSVLILQFAFSPLTEDSDLAIAGSTLAVASLFRPARSRIQDLVDRRFYRRKYDAARTLAAFGTQLRDEVDLDALGRSLRIAVTETMQPAYVSQWLRRHP